MRSMRSGRDIKKRDFVVGGWIATLSKRLAFLASLQVFYSFQPEQKRERRRQAPRRFYLR